MNKVLISVVGPTAIGKTRLAIFLAQYFETEILSADSRQFFKEMSIGTAVPSKDELESAAHHFIQHKSITESYSVGDFEKDAISKLKELFKENNIVIMVGGSGLYVDAVTKGLDEFPKVADGVREKLNKELKEKGLEYLQSKLKQLDSEYYTKVDIYNPHRLVRALEVCISSGKSYSSFLNLPKKERAFKILTIGINAERSLIYDRINQRVDVMMENGLLKEVTTLHPYQNLNALQTVGYKELFQYLNGNWALEFAISEIKKNTRRFAKRQLTWFKKTENIKWVSHNHEPNDIFKLVENELIILNNE